jgi:hypothetical protein
MLRTCEISYQLLRSWRENIKRRYEYHQTLKIPEEISLENMHTCLGCGGYTSISYDGLCERCNNLFQGFYKVN